MMIHNLTTEQRQKIVQISSDTIYPYIRRELAKSTLGVKATDVEIAKLADTPYYMGSCLSVSFILHLALKAFDIDSRLLKVQVVLANMKATEYFLKHGHAKLLEVTVEQNKVLDRRKDYGGDYLFIASLGLPEKGKIDLHASLGFRDGSIFDPTVQQAERSRHKMPVNAFWVNTFKELPANFIMYDIEKQIAYNDYDFPIKFNENIELILRKVISYLEPIIGRPHKNFTIKRS